MPPVTPESTGAYRWDFSEGNVPESGAGQVGPYTVIERLGVGGMGTVLRVSDPSGRHLALKLLAPTADRDAHVRFEREGQVTAALRHPGIVEIYGAGRAGEQPYLVYELVEGKDLKQQLPQLSRDERLTVVLAVAHALGYAHKQGVVHRDVKPANILIGDDDRVLVADFGLAQAAGLERLTLTGTVVGTPRSMSPEQFSGHSRDYGPETDVWALGALLYEVLTDQSPFPGATLAELMAQILAAKPTPPRELDASIPIAIQAVCEKALRKLPEDRYSDGAAFAEALETACRGAAEGNPLIRGALILALIVAVFAAVTLAGLAQPTPDRPASAGGLGLGVGDRASAGGEGASAVVPSFPEHDAALDQAAERPAVLAISALRGVTESLRERPGAVARLDGIRLRRIRRARQLEFGSEDLSSELELLGILRRCRSAGVVEDAEFLAAEEDLAERLLSLADERMWVDTHAVKAGNSTLTALADSGVSLDAAGMGAATRLSDSYLAGVRFETVTGAQYLDGLVALARLDVRLEQAHFLLYLIGNSLQDSRAWLGAASAEPVRRAVQLLIQTGLADLRPTRTKLREMLRDPTPAWGPRLRARVLGFVSFDGPEGVALERLREARRLDPRSPWLLGVLAERQLEAGRSRQALESVDASLVLHYAEALDTRVGTRWETAWLEAKGVQALAHLEKYKEAGARLDALLRSPTSPAALVNLRRRGVINVLERQLGRTFERAKPLGWRTD